MTSGDLPRVRARDIASIFLLQCSAYFIITLNMRAVADTNYLWTAVTDVGLAAIAFTSIQRVAAARTREERIAYILGGVLGAQLALLSSSLWSW